MTGLYYALLSIHFVLASAAFASDESGELDIDQQQQASAAKVSDLKDEKEAASGENRTQIDSAINSELRTMEKRADDQPKKFKAQKSTAAAFLKAKEPARALDRANRSVALAPNDPTAYVLRGNAEYQLGNYPEATADAKIALNFDPQNKQAAALLNVIGDRAGPSSLDLPKRQHQKAHPFGDQADASQPRTASMGNPASASAAPLRMSAENPFAACRALNQGEADLKLGNFEGALAQADKAIASGAKTAKAYDLRAEAKLGLKKNRDALNDSAQSLSVAPNDARGYLLRAKAKEALGFSSQEILADFQNAAQLDSNLRADYEAAQGRIGGGTQNRFAALSYTREGAQKAWWPIRKWRQIMVGRSLHTPKPEEAQQIRSVLDTVSGTTAGRQVVDDLGGWERINDLALLNIGKTQDKYTNALAVPLTPYYTLKFGKRYALVIKEALKDDPPEVLAPLLAHELLHIKYFESGVRVRVAAGLNVSSFRRSIVSTPPIF